MSHIYALGKSADKKIEGDFKYPKGGFLNEWHGHLCVWVYLGWIHRNVNIGFAISGPGKTGNIKNL